MSLTQVACPQCGKKSPWDTANRFRPFCCERCKLIDMGAWASESYRVPVTEVADELIDTPQDSADHAQKR